MRHLSEPRHVCEREGTERVSKKKTLSPQPKTFADLHFSYIGRDVFEILSSATIDWLITNDAQLTHLELEKQVDDLLQELQASRGDTYATENNTFDVTTMLHTDNFGFGEMLSSFAQWPEYLGTDFADYGCDQVMI